MFFIRHGVLDIIRQTFLFHIISMFFSFYQNLKHPFKKPPWAKNVERKKKQTSKGLKMKSFLVSQKSDYFLRHYKYLKISVCAPKPNDRKIKCAMRLVPVSLEAVGVHMKPMSSGKIEKWQWKNKDKRKPIEHQISKPEESKKWRWTE